MDKLATYRQYVKQLLSEYANHRFSHGEIESYPIFDTEHVAFGTALLPATRW